MNPLKIALVVKGTPAGFERERRNMGYFSYPVPEFTWRHYSLADGRVEDRGLYGDHDLIICEDVGGNAGHFSGRNGPPIVYLAIDTTLSEQHFEARIRHARRADLVLVDHDRLERFAKCRAVRRLNYCVNDHVFRQLPKGIDITFHCGSGARLGMPGGRERNAIRGLLGQLSRQHGWSYRSGAVSLREYAENMGRSRVVVNWPRTPTNRPHRVFDAMACGACLLTGRIPSVGGDGLLAGEHYAEFQEPGELEAALSGLLPDGWQEIARRGRELVMSRHTWAARARELREIIREELGL